MIRRGCGIFILLHCLYASIWIFLDEKRQVIVERYVVTLAVSVAFIAYVLLVIAYYGARKTKLNTALALNKFYWALLLGFLVLPGQWGVLIRDAPWRIAERNSYSYWIAPAWLRTYLWICLTITIIGVLYEFCEANDWFRMSPAAPPEDRVVRQIPDRRSGSRGRRATD